MSTKASHRRNAVPQASDAEIGRLAANHAEFVRGLGAIAMRFIENRATLEEWRAYKVLTKAAARDEEARSIPEGPPIAKNPL